MAIRQTPCSAKIGGDGWSEADAVAQFLFTRQEWCGTVALWHHGTMAHWIWHILGPMLPCSSAKLEGLRMAETADRPPLAKKQGFG